MSSTPRTQQIESDIDRTRAAMDRTFDAIAGKLTPQQLLVEALSVFKSGGTTLAQKLVETAREHPVPATIIGIGVGMMLTEKGSRNSHPGPSHVAGMGPRELIGEASTAASYGLHRAEEKASAVAHRVEHAASSAAETVKETASEVKEKAAGAATHLKEGAQHLTDKVKESADHVREQAARVPLQARTQWHDAQLGFWRTMDGNPLAVGAAAMAAGLATGLSVPSTRKEQELMGQTRDRVVSQAQDVGREALDRGKHVARAAVDAVKTEAQKQGLSASVLVDKVKQVTREAEQVVKAEVDRALPESLKTDATSRTPLGSGTASALGAPMTYNQSAPTPGKVTDPTR